MVCNLTIIELHILGPQGAVFGSSAFDPFYSIYLEKWRRRGLSGKKLIKTIINQRLKFIN